MILTPSSQTGPTSPQPSRWGRPTRIIATIALVGVLTYYVSVSVSAERQAYGLCAELDIGMSRPQVAKLISAHRSTISASGDQVTRALRTIAFGHYQCHINFVEDRVASFTYESETWEH